MTELIRRTRNQRTPGRSNWLPIVLSFILVIIFSFFVVAAFLGYELWEQWQPSEETVEFDFNGMDKPVYFQGVLQTKSALGEKDGLMLPLSMLQDKIDPNIYYEKESGSIVVTAHDKVLQFETDQLTATLNGQETVDLQFPVRNVDGEIMIPLHPLIDLYDIYIQEAEETGAVMIWKAGDAISWGTVMINEEAPLQSALRIEPSLMAPMIKLLSEQTRVMILEERDGWYQVLLENGYSGYVVKNKIKLSGVEVLPPPSRKELYVPWKPRGQKINLTWEAVYNSPPDPNQINEMPGVNVVSPTWFELLRRDDGELYVANKADSRYVNWAQQRGYQVWALFGNSFEPEWTSELLSTYERRMKVIQELLYYAELYNLQGINIDFENVYVRDKDLLTQFVRELVPLFHEQNLVVSMDVTIRGGSPQWSLFYDRQALGRLVDYMMVMTYDEHWAASPVAGSVASLPWVEKGIVDIMEMDHVPASKLVLGVPLYTRVWTEREEDGQTIVSSKSASMKKVDQIIEQYDLQPVFLNDVGQDYFEYSENGNLNRVWIENANSMRRRIDLVHKYDLAGVASWQRGFAKPEIWNVMEQELSRVLP